MLIGRFPENIKCIPANHGNPYGVKMTGEEVGL
jgi:hypothetical protein